MKYLSVCSGIEAATQAFHPLGWLPVAFSEIEPFPCAVLAHHYPDVPNWGDMTKFQEWPDATVDVLCGGTPCQDYSVAGLRAGMDAPRGNLTITFGLIAARYRPRWIQWENVPGVLSSNGGRDFARFLGLLAGRILPVPDGGWQNSGIVPGIGSAYGLAYRILDAQHVRTRGFPRAVPQRRRRVFVVGYLGDWRRAAAVLFDRESLSGHPAPRREAGKGLTHDVAGSLVSSGRGVERAGDTRGQDPVIGVQSNSGEVGYCLTASAQQSLDAETETLLAVACPVADSLTVGANQTWGRPGGEPVAHAPISFGAQNAAAQGDGVAIDFVPALDKSKTPAVAFDLRGREGGSMPEGPHDTASIRAASGGSSRSYVAAPWAVRRLTPRECERLMGFPDDFTRIPYRGKPADKCPDGPRYKALGNSWAVNAASWIGERMAEVDAW